MTLYEGDMSNTSDTYATKPELWRPLSDTLGGFDLDPASGAESSPIATERYSESDNGLAQPWYGTVWLNPPFSKKDEFYKKATAEVKRDAVDCIVALAPVDTSTQWFQRRFSQADIICWLEGRDWYVASGSPSFNTAVGVFGQYPSALVERLSNFGVVTEQYQTHQQQTITDPNP
jgi:hypothetical protein